MSNDYIKSVIFRFLRVGVSAGIANALIICTNPGPMADWSDFNRFLIILSVAFVSGFLSAADKLMRYKKEKDNL